MAPRVIRPERIWTRREIEGQIAEGRKIFILDGQVIKADAWCPYHPGGDKAILHMVGRDGTLEIRALHSPEAQEHMLKFKIGTIDGRWDNMLPPIQGGHFRPYEQQQTEEAEKEEHSAILEESNSSSSSSTAPSSPVFDPVDGTSLRKRGQTDNSSISSVSSQGESRETTSPNSTFVCTNPSNEIRNYPALDHASQDAIVARYRVLDARLRAEGFYDCPYFSYAIECSRYITLFSLFLVFLHYQQFALSALFLGLTWHQLVFTAHDAGHMGITHKFHVDTCIGIVISDFIGGLSMGWWKRNHNVHHIVTNSPEHDPDIEHIPFFAISTRFFSSLRSTYYDRIMPFDRLAQLAVRYQHWLYYPILLLGRFNLYLNSWTYLLTGQAPRKGPAWWHWYLEIAGNLFFWYWFGYLTVYKSIPTAMSRFTFVMISHMVTAPLHVQITLSHFAMSTADLGVHESFPQKMLRTTMDVDCPAWLDFVHGGLQFQAVHHLFPRVPRHNLRKASGLVREFCAEVGIPYVIFGFGRGNGEVLGRLEEVAGQVMVWEEGRKAAAKEIVEGHVR